MRMRENERRADENRHRRKQDLSKRTSELVIQQRPSHPQELRTSVKWPGEKDVSNSWLTKAHKKKEQRDDDDAQRLLDPEKCSSPPLKSRRPHGDLQVETTENRLENSFERSL